MIKMSATGANGRKVMILGLEEENVLRMREGLPIHIHADHLGFPGEIVIILGKDAAALRETLAPFITSDTVVNDKTQKAKH